MAEIESLDIDNALKKWADFTVDRFLKAMTKFKIGVTGALFRSFVNEVVKAGGDVESVFIKFLNYGRFPDMGVGNGASLNELVLNRRYDVYRNSEGKMEGRIKRRAKKWYSKILYKRIAELKYILPEELSSQIQNNIIEQIERA